MITVSGLSKSFGGRTLFEGVTFKLMPGRRVALVGANGVGKTTLLKIIVGIQQANAGEIHIGKGTRIGYLPQELTEQIDGSVIEEVLRGAAHVTDLEAKLSRLLDEVAATAPDGPTPDAEAYSSALDAVRDCPVPLRDPRRLQRRSRRPPGARRARLLLQRCGPSRSGPVRRMEDEGRVSPDSCSPPRICWSSTNRRTISTSNRSPGSRITWPPGPERSCS